jgi:hypothetical protein
MRAFGEEEFSDQPGVALLLPSRRGTPADVGGTLEFRPFRVCCERQSERIAPVKTLVHIVGSLRALVDTFDNTGGTFWGR